MWGHYNNSLIPWWRKKINSAWYVAIASNGKNSANFEVILIGPGKFCAHFESPNWIVGLLDKTYMYAHQYLASNRISVTCLVLSVQAAGRLYYKIAIRRLQRNHSLHTSNKSGSNYCMMSQLMCYNHHGSLVAKDL